MTAVCERLITLLLWLQAVNYTLPDGTAVTVQRGFWFSAHEQWKTWTLPYLDVSSRVAGACCRLAVTAAAE